MAAPMITPMRNELLTEAKHNDYRPSSEAERVAAEEWRNEQRRDAYLYRRDSYERAAIERNPLPYIQRMQAAVAELRRRERAARSIA